MKRHDIDEDSTRIDEVIAEYISSEDAGTPVDREAIMAKHPELATELRQFFGDRDRFRKAARPLSMATSQSQDRVTKLRYFGDFELVEEIATGGMGVVYKARQTSLNRIVAVKMIRAAHLATDDDIRRFQEEAQTAAALRHRSIVPIHEVGMHNSQHYFSMEFIDGNNLADRIRTKPPAPDEAARIIQTVAEALDYAHQQGTIHRDVKPSNILIDQQGQVHITDFGLAMRVEGDSELTRTACYPKTHPP
jgi:serine/threonine protein kinase